MNYLNAYDIATRRLEDNFNCDSESLKSFFNRKDILLKGNYIDSDEINKYPELNLEELQTELPLFKRKSIARFLEDAILYYNSCMENIKKIYSNVKILMKVIILRPTSSVECERSFSNMSTVKNWLRNTMEQKRLDSLMICSIHSETLYELNIDELMLSFVKKTEWREKMF